MKLLLILGATVLGLFAVFLLGDFIPEAGGTHWPTDSTIGAGLVAVSVIILIGSWKNRTDKTPWPWPSALYFMSQGLMKMSQDRAPALHTGLYIASFALSSVVVWRLRRELPWLSAFFGVTMSVICGVEVARAFGLRLPPSADKDMFFFIVAVAVTTLIARSIVKNRQAAAE